MTDVPTTCEGCGLCCKHGVDGRVPFRDGEPVPARYQAEHAATSLTPGVACPWWCAGRSLDGQAGECLHYDDRPAICAGWEIGGRECMDIRAEYFVQLGA